VIRLVQYHTDYFPSEESLKQERNLDHGCLSPPHLHPHFHRHPSKSYGIYRYDDTVM